MVRHRAPASYHNTNPVEVLKNPNLVFYRTGKAHLQPNAAQHYAGDDAHQLELSHILPAAAACAKTAVTESAKQAADIISGASIKHLPSAVSVKHLGCTANQVTC